MSRIKRILAISMVLLLTGCTFKSGDDLLAVPKPPNDFLDLQEMIDELLLEGLVYAAPKSGNNRNAVQLVDIDADGEEEAISFFRESTTSGNFQVYLHKRMNEEYIEMGVINGDGTEIDSVYYPKFSANGNLGIIVTWQLGTGVTKGMTVATFTPEGRLETLGDMDFDAFTYTDLDNDGVDEILTIVTDATSGKLKARAYDYSDEELTMISEIPLSAEADTIHTLHEGMIAEGIMGIYVESRLEGFTGLVTDVLILSGNEMRNITLDTKDNLSSSTYRPTTVISDDKNGNGILEIPHAIAMPGYDATKEGEVLWYLNWNEYSFDGTFTKTSTTYQNSAEEWQLLVPSAWIEKVTAVRRLNETQAYTSFEVYDENGENVPILEIYALTGDNISYVSNIPGHFTVAANETVTYSARIPQEAEENSFALSEGEVKANFSILQNKWIS